MTQHSPTQLHSADVPRRPKGILKNSYHNSPPNQATANNDIAVSDATPGISARPDLDRELSDKDVTLQNTLSNAGHRRSSSNPRGSVSRRQSSNAGLTTAEEEDNNPRLKWDEANLYLTEQEKSSTMKIDEPKTPYAQHYDPGEDDAEMRTLDADDLVVDELDRVGGRTTGTKDDEIPGLELGEPEEAIPENGGDGTRSRSGSTKGEKQVMVDPLIDDGMGGHGEPTFGESPEEREKHRKFEELRKRHYEMRDVKGLLGHPEDLDDEDEELPPHVSANGRK
ncbi:MAG: hypothetical protein M1827_000181 [Pycnora praestabilis]|nr:MAG: hypothetical protein M1827_000181 [Pycnora praestabilis]